MHFNRKNIVLTIIICILAVLLAATGGVLSKYKEAVTLDSNVTVSSGKLASVFTLQEHMAVQNSDGTYSLDLSVDPVQNNSYKVLPGVALPKDPYFTITKKTDIEAYLYVEIIDGLAGTGLNYAVTTDWKDLGITSTKGGKVYVYTGGEANAKKLTDGFSENALYILQDDQITVTSENKSDLGEVTLSFHGYLAQASLANDATAVFTTCFGGTN